MSKKPEILAPGIPLPSGAPMQVDLDKCDDIVCTSCGGTLFQQVIGLKKVSALISPTGKEGIVFVEKMVCHACGEDLKQEQMK